MDNMAKIYRYQAKTPLSLSQSIFQPEETEDYIEAELYDGKAVIYDSYRKIGDESVREGLTFDIFLDEWEESEARGWKNLFASLLSFSSKTEVERPKLVQKIESSEDQPKLRQIYRINRSMPPQIQKVDVDLFGELNNRLTRIYDEDRDLFRELGRAFNYYRKSLGEMKAEDQFTDLYIVLDALKLKLRDHYISENDADGSQRKKYGLIQLFDEFSEHDFMDEIYEARCELFHEGKKQKAVSLVEELEEAVERALLLLLNIDYGQYEDTLSRDISRIGKEPAMFLSGNLENYEVPEDGIAIKLPHFDTDETTVDIIPIQEGDGEGVGINPEIGDFIEAESDGITGFEAGFGARGTGPQGSMEDLP